MSDHVDVVQCICQFLVPSELHTGMQVSKVWKAAVTRPPLPPLPFVSLNNMDRDKLSAIPTTSKVARRVISLHGGQPFRDPLQPLAENALITLFPKMEELHWIAPPDNIQLPTSLRSLTLDCITEIEHAVWIQQISALTCLTDLNLQFPPMHSSDFDLAPIAASPQLIHLELHFGGTFTPSPAQLASLRSMHRLESLNIEGGLNCLELLAPEHQFSSLRLFDLSEVTVNIDHVTVIQSLSKQLEVFRPHKLRVQSLKFLRDFPRLRSLAIRPSHRDDVFTDEHAFQTLRRLPQITELTLNNMPDFTDEHLKGVLSKMKELRSLVLIRMDGITSLRPLKMVRNTLTSLIIRDSRSMQSAKVAHLCRLTALQKLILRESIDLEEEEEELLQSSLPQLLDFGYSPPNFDSDSEDEFEQEGDDESDYDGDNDDEANLQDVDDVENLSEELSD